MPQRHLRPHRRQSSGWPMARHRAHATVLAAPNPCAALKKEASLRTAPRLTLAPSPLSSPVHHGSKRHGRIERLSPSFFRSAGTSPSASTSPASLSPSPASRCRAALLQAAAGPARVASRPRTASRRAVAGHGTTYPSILAYAQHHLPREVCPFPCSAFQCTARWSLPHGHLWPTAPNSNQIPLSALHPSLESSSARTPCIAVLTAHHPR